jgi:hypothetical protein
MGALFSAGVVTTLFLAVAGAVIYALIGELNKRFFQVQPVRVLLIMLGTLVLGALLLSMLENPVRSLWLRSTGWLTYQWSDADAHRPVVIGIYPDEGFGLLHRTGLHTALEEHPEVQPLDLTDSLDRMRANESSELLTRLRETITTRNVIGIVGPPVTEFTEAVIRTVQQSGRHPPLFITSAAPREDSWSSENWPVYRVNSGADERAAEFAALARTAISNGVPLTFLVEVAPNGQPRSYGELVLDRIRQHLPRWQEWVSSDQIRSVTYSRDRILDELRGRADRLFGERRIIMLLGLGGDYETVVRTYYKQSDPPRQALFGGWMNAYRVQSNMATERLQWGRLFEITDIDFPPRRATETLRRRLQEDVTPATRDQAFSFDAGTVLMTAYTAVLGARSPTTTSVNGRFLRNLHQRIGATRTRGATGAIIFDPRGQNVELAQMRRHGMSYAYFDGQRWQAIQSFRGVVARALTPAPAPPAVAVPQGR